ncbi:MAG TPA: MarR family transcriptional regulator [Ramlibacter sp.]|nr:MarR family transcriptional regulator [Ramlibacter sp.]
MAERFLDQHLGHLLGQATHAVYKDFDEHVRRAGLSPSEWRVLAALHDAEPLTVGQLARQVRCQQPTATKLAQRMAEQGWVALLADEADQRCTRVGVTPAGRRLVKPLVAQARAHEAHMLRALGAGEKKVLRQLLSKLCKTTTN